MAFQASADTPSALATVQSLTYEAYDKTNPNASHPIVSQDVCVGQPGWLHPKPRWLRIRLHRRSGAPPVTRLRLGSGNLSLGTARKRLYYCVREKPAVFFEVWVFLLVVLEEYSSWSSPRAVGFMHTLPGIIAPWRLGQCRVLMLRVLRPVVSRLA